MSRRLSYISFAAAYLVVIWIVFFVRSEPPHGIFIETVASGAAISGILPPR